ncbi:MAG: hypothetical protein V1774_08445 [Candidatus Eisenbacteria bacterium]
MERNLKRPNRAAPGKPPRGGTGRKALPPDPDALGVELGKHRLVLLLVSVGVIAAGFVALVLGSTTLAPLLLVIGYLAAVPYALMAGRGRDNRPASPGSGGSQGADSSAG